MLPCVSVSNRSQMTSKCRKNKEEAHEPQASVSLLFLPHFDVLCDLLLNRPKATWNLFVFYTITEILRALWLADACYLLEDRCTNDVTAWRDPRAWSKFIAVSRAGKDFQNSGPKQSEKYSALVEDFSEKETAEYQSQWEAFNSAKHARSLPGKKLSKAAWKLCCRKVCRRRGKSTNADEWQRLNTFSCSLLSRITLQMK